MAGAGGGLLWWGARRASSALLKPPVGLRGVGSSAGSACGGAPLLRWFSGLKAGSSSESLSRVEGGGALEGMWQSLGLSQEDMDLVLARTKFIGSEFALAHLPVKVKWLEGFGLTRDEISKVVRSHPNFIGYSIQNLDSHVAYFRSIGLDEKGIRRIVAVSPRSLGLSVEKNIKPTVEWLRSHGLQGAEIARVLARAPQLLSCSVENNLQRTVDWLVANGVPEEKMRQLIASFPQLLLLSIAKKLENMLLFLRAQGCTAEEVISITRDYPGLFRYKIEGNLDVKWRYLIDTIGVTKEEIVEWPRILSYSLDDRIGPRWSYMKAQKREGRANVILTPTDPDFALRVAKGSLKDYVEFRREWRAEHQGQASVVQ